MQAASATGPLVTRWLAARMGEPRAGAHSVVEVELENAGSAAWRSRGGEGVQLSYHWLDERGNALVWDGLRTPFETPVQPGEQRSLQVGVRVPMPRGRYRLALDLVDEGRFWFAEVGNAPLEVGVEVLPRIARRALAVRGADPGALDRQDESPVGDEAEAEAIAYLGPGCVPAPDWARRVLDAHEEGFAAVGGAVETASRLGRAPRGLAPWAPGGGRNPSWSRPLLCPSLVRDLDPDWTDAVEGLPALRPPAGEPWLYDGRIVVTARPRSGRPRG